MGDSRRPAARTLLVLFAAASLAGVAGAQEPAPPSELRESTQPVSPPRAPAAPEFVRVEIMGPKAVARGERIRYRLVLVDDRQGQPVVAQAAAWSIEPAEAGEIDPDGTVRFAKGKGDSTATITAVYREQQPQRPGDAPDSPGAEWRARASVRIVDTSDGPGFALWFDGLEAKAVIPRSPRLETAEMTLELWARVEGDQHQFTRLARKIGPQSAHGYILSLAQAPQRLVQFRQMAVLATDSDTFDRYAGQWHHFAITYSRTSASLIIDGEVVETRPHRMGPLRHSPTSDLIIGNGLESKLEAFRGTIDEVRVWDRPLSPAEVRERMYGRVKRGTSGLVAAYRFDDPSTQRLTDSSGLDLHGMLGDSLQPDAADPRIVVSDRPRTPEDFRQQRKQGELVAPTEPPRTHPRE